MYKILVFGDSIAYGAVDLEEGGWVNRLKNYLAREGKAEVYNLGVSGNNTNDLLARFDVESQARNPKTIVFAIGIIDSSWVNSKGDPRVALKTFQDNITTLIGQARKYTKRIIFVGLTKVNESKTNPIPWNTAVHYDNESIVQYNSALKTICEKENLVFIEVLDSLGNDDLEDGVHPNSEGHKKLFEKIKNALGTTS